jgi:hypothetical protein
VTKEVLIRKLSGDEFDNPLEFSKLIGSGRSVTERRISKKAPYDDAAQGEPVARFKLAQKESIQAGMTHFNPRAKAQRRRAARGDEAHLT